MFNRCFPIISLTEKTKTLGLNSSVSYLVAEFGWRLYARGPLFSFQVLLHICLSVVVQLVVELRMLWGRQNRV